MKRNYFYLLLALCIGAVVMSCRPKNNPEDPKHPHLGETELDEFSPVGTIGTIDGREGIVVDLGDTLGRVIIATMNVGATSVIDGAGSETTAPCYGDYLTYDDAKRMSEDQAWGEGWYVPTYEELKALVSHLKRRDCYSYYQWAVTKSSILCFPLAGYINHKDDSPQGVGCTGFYASCTDAYSDETIWGIDFNMSYAEMRPNYKDAKLSVRLFHSLPTPANAVDLGLPSGTMWAAMNMGAVTIADLGDCVAWGELEPKDEYTWANYKWCEGRDSTFTKYCTNPAWGKVDNKIVLDPEDDIAHVRWGDNWRLPLASEWQELIDNCSWAETTENGVLGIMVTGKNGKSIFLPADNVHQEAEYASRSLDVGWDNASHTWIFSCHNHFNDCSYRRCYANQIRPILTYKVHSGKQN